MCLPGRARSRHRSLPAILILAAAIVGAAPSASAVVAAFEGAGVVQVKIVGPDNVSSSLSAVSAVEIRAIGETNRSWSARISGHGSATFRGLPPGTYHVTLDLPDGGTTTINVRVDAGEFVSVNATLVPATAGTSHLDVVERHRDGEGNDFRQSQLLDLPGTANLWALIDTAAPFVISNRIDGGGLGTARSSLLGTRGASFTTTSLSFGDVEIWNPDRLGALAIWPDLGAVDAVAVASGLAPVEVASPGVAISLVPRRPGDRAHGALDAAFTTPRMVSTNAGDGPPSIAKLDSWKNVGFQFSGPVGKRVGFFMSDALTSADLFERSQGLDPKSQAVSTFTHVVARPTDRDEVRVVGAVQGTTHAYDGRAQLENRNATERDTFWQSQFTWDRLGSSGGRRQLSFGAQRGSADPRVGDGIGGTIDRVFDGVVPSAPASGALTRLEGHAEFQPRDARVGGIDHGTRVGVTFGDAFSSSRVLATPTVAELVDGLPARVWQDTMPGVESHRRVWSVQAYAADEMRIGNALSVSAGLRADLSAGHTQGGSGATWRTIVPRLSFQWNPGWMTVFGGYGQYRPRMSLDLLAFGDPGEPVALVSRWNDLNGNNRFDDGEIGPLVARAGRGASVASIDPSLRAPRTDEWMLGIAHQLGVSIFRGALVFRREHDVLGSVNTGVPLSDYRVLSVPDQGEDYSSPRDDRLLTVYDRAPASFGLDHYVLTNPAGGAASYDGAELSWTLASNRWYVLFGAMAYRTRAMGGNRGFDVLDNDQGVIGELFENPNAASYSLGSTFFDRSYVAKWSTSYDAPHDLHVGVSVRYQDGQPFSRLVIAPDLAQGPEVVSAYRTGRTRFTFTSTVDARIEKGLTIAGRRVAVRVDIFNLTNQAFEVEENPVSGPFFRDTTAIQPPRTVRIGFRINF